MPDDQQDAERRALDQAIADARAPRTGEDVERRLATLERWKSQLRGESGITVQGEVITMDGQPSGQPDSTSGGTVRVVRIVVGGVATDVNLLEQV